jgi:hypothetical protein
MRVWVMLAALGVVCAAGVASAQENSRSLLEKKLYFVTDKGKLGEAPYWSLHLGSHQCTLRRKFPGEDTTSVDATMNLTLVSSGYISGNGFSDKGKVDCLTGFMIAVGDSVQKIALDSIDYAWNDLQQVALRGGPTGELRVLLEGKAVPCKGLALTTYKMVDYYGEKVLRKDADLTITAMAFTKDGIKRAQAAIGQTTAGKK